MLGCDLRGHGRSPAAPPFSLRQQVADLVATIEANCRNESVVLLGHSFGGLVASCVAAERPDLVSALVLIDPALRIDTSTASEILQLPLSWKSLEDARQGYRKALEPSTVDEGMRWFESSWKADWRGVSLSVQAEAVRAAVDAMVMEPFDRRVFSGPTLVVIPERGRLISPRAERLAEENHSTVTTVRGCHDVAWSVPDEAAAAISRFLIEVGLGRA